MLFLDAIYLRSTCALFRTESLRAVGGFESHRWSPYEDWETFVKMVVSGLQVEVLPRPLFYYRTNSGGRLEELTSEAAMTFRHRAHLIDEFFADAELTAQERRALWECLLAFEHLLCRGINEQVAWYKEQMAELAQWHDEEMEKLNAWRADQMEELRANLTQNLEAEHARARRASTPPRRRAGRELVGSRVSTFGRSRSLG